MNSERNYEDDADDKSSSMGREDKHRRRSPDRITVGYRGPIPPANKVFAILIFASLFLISRHWNLKSRDSTPFFSSFAPSEIAAFVSLLVSLFYLAANLLL